MQHHPNSTKRMTGKDNTSVSGFPLQVRNEFSKIIRNNFKIEIIMMWRIAVISQIHRKTIDGLN